MESNREESIRCIDIAIAKYNEGNLEGCIKFLNKSISLYPSDRAKELLATYTSTTTTTTTNKQTTSTDGSTTTTSSSKTTSTTTEQTESIKPKYTSEQVAAIKRIRSCKSFYEVLEVTKTSTDTDIKKAYRKLALQMHPDKNHAPGAEEAFKKVTQAFSCLSDPKKKQAYDLHGSEDTPAARSPFSRGGGVYYEDDISPEDIFNIFFGIPTNGARNRRGGGGGNFYASSMGGSPFGNGVQFNFGGMPMNNRRRQHPHHQHQHQGADQQESTYSFLIILIPLILFFLSIFGGGSSSNSNVNNSRTYATLYNFEQNQVFQKEHIIPIDLSHNQKIDIQYFVKTDFERYKKNGLDMKSFETDVVNNWVQFKKPHCKKKLEYDEILKKNPNDNKILNELRINEFKYKYCDILNKNKTFK